MIGLSYTSEPPRKPLVPPRTIRHSERSKSSGKWSGPARTIRRSDTCKLSGSHRACDEFPPIGIRRASRRHGTTERAARHAVLSTEGSVECDVAAEPRTIR